MSDYVIMPTEDYKAACDTIRAASGKTTLIKSGDMSSEISALINKIGKAEFKTANVSSKKYWQSVTYGDGKFVAVPYNNSVGVYSIDGVNWSTYNLPSNKKWSSITYGGGKFIAVAESSSTGAYSFDGVNWHECSLPRHSYWASIAYGDNKFVVVDNEAYLYNIAYCDILLTEIA